MAKPDTITRTLCGFSVTWIAGGGVEICYLPHRAGEASREIGKARARGLLQRPTVRRGDEACVPMSPPDGCEIRTTR